MRKRPIPVSAQNYFFILEKLCPQFFCCNLRRLLKTVTKNNHDETNPYTHRP